MVDLPPQLLHFSLGLCLELQSICAMVRKWWGLLIPPFLGIPFFMACNGFIDLHEWLPHEFQSAGSLAPPQLSAVPSPFLAASEKEHQSPTQTQAIGNPSKGKEKHLPRRFKLGSKDGMLSKLIQNIWWFFGLWLRATSAISLKSSPTLALPHPSAVVQSLKVQLLDLERSVSKSVRSAHWDIVLVRYLNLILTGFYSSAIPILSFLVNKNILTGINELSATEYIHMPNSLTIKFELVSGIDMSEYERITDHTSLRELDIPACTGHWRTCHCGSWQRISKVTRGAAEDVEVRNVVNSMS